MKNSVLLALLFSFSIAKAAPANEIIINITGKNAKETYDKKPLCKLQYDITNNSTGTIYYLRAHVDGWDDRGDQVDEMLFSSIDNVGPGFSGRVPIRVGNTIGFEMEYGFEVRCQYLAKIIIEKIQPENCNIRMLPEDADCIDIVVFKSSVDGLTAE